jgi:hypothetical protein
LHLWSVILPPATALSESMSALSILLVYSVVNIKYSDRYGAQVSLLLYRER